MLPALPDQSHSFILYSIFCHLLSEVSRISFLSYTMQRSLTLIVWINSPTAETS